MHIAEPNPPANLNITANGLNLMATWSEPFSLEGEKLSYVVSITNTARLSGVQTKITVNTSRYVLTEPIAIGDRDCAEYQFTVFSKNDYSISNSSINGNRNLPTGIIIQMQVTV